MVKCIATTLVIYFKDIRTSAGQALMKVSAKVLHVPEHKTAVSSVSQVVSARIAAVAAVHVTPPDPHSRLTASLILVTRRT